MNNGTAEWELYSGMEQHQFRSINISIKTSELKLLIIIYNNNSEVLMEMLILWNWCFGISADKTKDASQVTLINACASLRKPVTKGACC